MVSQGCIQQGLSHLSLSTVRSYIQHLPTTANSFKKWQSMYKILTPNIRCHINSYGYHLAATGCNGILACMGPTLLCCKYGRHCMNSEPSDRNVLTLHEVQQGFCKPEVKVLYIIIGMKITRVINLVDPSH